MVSKNYEELHAIRSVIPAVSFSFKDIDLTKLSEKDRWR